MAEFLSRLVGVLLLRDGPQDMPAGTSALTLSIALYLGATAASVSIGEGADNPMAVLALAAVLPLILTRIVLGIGKRPERWNQTMTALFGTSALLSLVSLPLATSTGNEPNPVVVIASLVLFFWSFAVDGHIWRHALEVSFAAGLAVAVVLFAVSMFVITSIAGPL
jgi:hypothetical protein